MILSPTSIYAVIYLKVPIFQMPKARFERSSCQRDWIWTDPSEPAPPSLQSSSTGWRWSFRGVSMWLAGNALSSPASSISPKLRYGKHFQTFLLCSFFFIRLMESLQYFPKMVNVQIGI